MSWLLLLPVLYPVFLVGVCWGEANIKSGRRR